MIGPNGLREAVTVVNDQTIVLGRLFGSELDVAEDAIVGDVMRSGPSTYRANVTVAEIIERVLKGNWETVPVTTPEGKLVGLAVREDMECAAAEKAPGGTTGD
jgi:predicted transcriptional regulator